MARHRRRARGEPRIAQLVVLVRQGAFRIVGPSLQQELGHAAASRTLEFQRFPWQVFVHVRAVHCTMVRSKVLRSIPWTGISQKSP